MITHEQLTEFFESTRQLHQTGKAKFDIDQVCKWSYFFIDSNAEKLASLGKRLDAAGFTYIGLLEPSPEDDDQETIYMRCDKVDTHTVDSLYSLNQTFYDLAVEVGVQDYDGMDVGAVDSP